MKFNFQLLLFLFLSSLFAEGQKLELANVDIKPLMWVDMEAADFDQDGDIDLFILGATNFTEPFTGLYINDGRGNFSLSSISFIQVYNGSIALNDLNGDLYPDIYITGSGEDKNPKTALYISDGQGSFILDLDFDLPAVRASSSVLKDIDQDGRIDLIVSGNLISNEDITRIYFGQANGKFDRTNFLELEWLSSGDLKVTDLDQDGDEDIIYAGIKDNISRTFLYSNEGARVFNRSQTNPFIGLNTGSISISDINNDGLPDIFLSGYSYELHIPQSRIYVNKGNLSFENLNSEFDNVVLSASGFGDFNNDNSTDLFITGYNQEKEEVVAKLYLNDGKADFEESTSLSLQGLQFSAVAISDFNGDGLNDLIYSGMKLNSVEELYALYSTGGCFEEKSTDRITSCEPYTWINGITYHESNSTDSLTLKNRFGCDSTVYLNLIISEPKFHKRTIITSRPYKHSDYSVYFQSQAGLLDTVSLSSGCDSIIVTDVEIIRPVSAAGFTRDTVTWPKEFDYDNYVYTDLNKDGHLDILMTEPIGLNSPVLISYLNDESNRFERVPNFFKIQDYRVIHLLVGDLDGDKDDDLLIWGVDTITHQVSLLKLNHENKDLFSIEKIQNIPIILNGSRHLQDIDQDGYDDLIIFDANTTLTYQDSSYDESTSTYIYSKPLWISKPENNIFLNDGSGEFRPVEHNGINQVVYSDIHFEDIDGDDDLDLLFTTRDYNTNHYKAYIYKQDSPGNFSSWFVSSETFLSIDVSGFISLNNDGHKDFILQGPNVNQDFVANSYLGNGDGSFNKTTVRAIPYRPLAIGDFDNDGDIDYINNPAEYWPFLYLNDGEYNYTKAEDSPFFAVHYSNERSTQVVDLNQDGYLDYIAEGIIYWNDGCQPDYYDDKQVAYLPFEWIDGQTYSNSTNVPRVVLKNQAGCDSVITLNLEYRNTPRGEGFVEITPDNIVPNAIRSIDIADINNDGLNDFGTAFTDFQNDSKLYFNNGDRTFINADQSYFNQEPDDYIFFNDIDLDGDLDLVLGSSNISVYRNNGEGFFSLENSALKSKMVSAGMDVADLNQDGYPDIAYSGYNENYRIFESGIFLNDGNGNFGNNVQGLFERVSYCTIKLIDLDGDIDSDIVISGYNESDDYVFNFYLNNGKGEFELYDPGISKIFVKTLKFADFDKDFDNDLIISGWEPGQSLSLTRLYENDGKGNFSLKNTLDDEYYFWNLDFYDLDADGDIDFIAQEEDNSEQLFTSFYENNGDLTFTRKPYGNIEGTRYGDIKISDLDGNKTPDFILSGTTVADKPIVRIFYNENPENKIYSDHTLDYIVSDGPIQWIDGNTYHESTNSVEHVLKNQIGGDSTIVLNLIINEKPLASDRVNHINVIYPNPSMNQLKLVLEEEPQYSINFQITDLQGTRRKVWSDDKKEQLIDIIDLESGTYFLRIQNKGMSDVLKFVKR